MGSVPDYVVADGPHGRALVVKGRWSPGASQALARGEADTLVLNYALGFSGSSLDMLDGAWPLRRLDVLDRSITDLGPIARMSGLVELSIQAADGAVLDLEPLSGLRSIAGEWSLFGRTLGALAQVERVITWRFSDSDLHAMRDHFFLRELSIKQAPRLESLSGVGGLPRLESLKIVGARRLLDVSEVAELAASLRELALEGCPRIDELDVLRSLVGLRLLNISECGDISSLTPIEALVQLERFYAWGSTRILDEDLSPLARLPRLKAARMRSRRNYKPQFTELAAAEF